MDWFAGIVISETLNLTAGNRSQAAKILHLSRPTLHSKIDKYRLHFETVVKTHGSD
jgi:DNA-binding NtrC family response regulator